MPIPRDEKAKTEGNGFLCITCKVGESIVIHLPDGRKVKIMNSRQRACGTTFGIDSPKDLKILRGELDGVERENVKMTSKLNGRVTNDPAYKIVKPKPVDRCPKCKNLEVRISPDVYQTHTCVGCKHVWLGNGNVQE